MSTRRRLQAVALCVLTVTSLAGGTASAANERRQQPQRRTFGSEVTVTRTRNALTGSASVTDSTTTARPRTRARNPQISARALAQRQRVNRFVRQRVGVLQKLDSYNSLRVTNPDGTPR